MSKLQWCPELHSIEDAFQVLETKYRNLKTEQAYIEFPDGKVARLQGHKHGVTPNIDIVMVNTHLLHNHPGHDNSTEYGLSGPDIGFALTRNLQSMTVFDSGLAVRISRPKTGWPKHPLTMLLFVVNTQNWSGWGDIDTWKIK